MFPMLIIIGFLLEPYFVMQPSLVPMVIGSLFVSSIYWAKASYELFIRPFLPTRT